MSFIKSIVGWFKREKDEPKCLSEAVQNVNPVRTPLMEAVASRQAASANIMAPGISYTYILSGIDRDIEETLKAIAAAEKSKKKRSHLKSKHRALKLKRLQIENKISDYKNVWS